MDEGFRLFWEKLELYHELANIVKEDNVNQQLTSLSISMMKLDQIDDFCFSSLYLKSIGAVDNEIEDSG